jgi:hypothetical protein
MKTCRKSGGDHDGEVDTGMEHQTSSTERLEKPSGTSGASSTPGDPLAGTPSRPGRRRSINDTVAAAKAAGMLPTEEVGANADDVYIPFEQVVATGSLVGARVQEILAPAPASNSAADNERLRLPRGATTGSSLPQRIEATIPIDESIRKIRSRNFNQELVERFPLLEGAAQERGTEDIESYSFQSSTRVSLVDSNAAAAAALQVLDEEEEEEEEDLNKFDDVQEENEEEE